MAVPHGRLSRLARMGGLGAGVAGNMLADGARRLAKGDRPALNDLLLTPKNAQVVADQLSQLRGAAMKVGQLISMDGGDFIPPELAMILSRLRASAYSMPPGQLKRVLDRNWGRDWLRTFRKFDVKPIAAASIGQVHRAQTKDGRDLAIKIQYPGVRESIESDVDNVSTLLKVSGLAPKNVDFAPLLDEAKKQLADEADYKREADYIRKFQETLGASDIFEIPAVYDDLTTPEILAMDYLPGRHVEEFEDSAQATRDFIVEQLMALLLKELFSFNLIQTDPNFANYLVGDDERTIKLLDFGATRDIDPDLSAGYRDLIRYGVDGDWAGIRKTVIAMGLASEDISAAHEEMLRDLFVMAMEPMRADGAFDFGNSDLAQRISEKGVALRTGGYVHLPPPVTLFIHRKISGIYLLATKLRARVNVRDLVRAYF